MRIWKAVSAILLIAHIFSELPALAQDVPSTAPVAVTPKVFDQVTFDNIRLSELIDYLRDQDPTFQAIVSYEPSGRKSDPIIDELNLHNVTTKDVLRVINSAYPNISMDEVNTGDRELFAPSQRKPKPAIWAIRIHGSETMTNVFPLREAVDRVSNGSQDVEARDKALNEVLSLLQTAARAGGAMPVDLQLHKSTELVIFQGSNRQGELIKEILSSLGPPPVNDQIEEYRAAVRDQEDLIRSLNRALEEGQAAHRSMTDRNEKLEKTINQLKLEIDVIKNSAPKQ